MLIWFKGLSWLVLSSFRRGSSHQTCPNISILFKNYGFTEGKTQKNSNRIGIKAYFYENKGKELASTGLKTGLEFQKKL